MLAKVFKSGNSMAIRIPKAINLQGITEFEIERIGANLIFKPKESKNEWGSFFQGVANFKEKIEYPKDSNPQERNFGKIFT